MPFQLVGDAEELIACFFLLQFSWGDKHTVCFWHYLIRSSAKGGGGKQRVILGAVQDAGDLINCIQHSLRGGGEVAHAATSRNLRIKPGASAGSYSSTMV